MQRIGNGKNNMFEQIKFEQIKKGKDFQEGVKMFQEGRVKKEGVGAIWVKKFVGAKDYNANYKNISSYCFIRKEDRGIWVGFCVTNLDPASCEILTDEESMQVDDYRRAHNIYPLPLGVVEK